MVGRVCRRRFGAGKRVSTVGWNQAPLINRLDAAKGLFALPRVRVGAGLAADTRTYWAHAHRELCTRYPPHHASNSSKRRSGRLARGASRSRFSSTDLDTAQTGTALRRGESRQTGPRSDSPSAKGRRGFQGLGDPTERRQPGSGGEQSTAWYRT